MAIAGSVKARRNEAVMIDIEKEAVLVNKTSAKIVKDLEKIPFTTALAVVNLLFVKMALSQNEGPNMAKAMAATFLNNVVNSIDSYYYGKDDEEPVH